MSYTIEASGAAIFNKPEGLVINAEQLSHPTFAQISSQSFKEDDTDHTATFHALVGGQRYTWIVSYSVEFASPNITINDVENHFPADTDLEEDINFYPVILDDEDFE